MKHVYLLVALVLLAACSAPADDAPRAVVIEDTTQEAPLEIPQEEQEVADTPVEQEAQEESDIIEIPVDTQASEFGFEGFGPGKNHLGTFNTWEGTLFEQDGVLVGGQGTIDMASVESDSRGLDNHLKGDDFFDVENHPESQFELLSITDGVARGKLTYLGVTKTVEFPIEVTDDAISADFVIDFTIFGWSYTGVNDEVRIFFTLVK